MNGYRHDETKVSGYSATMSATPRRIVKPEDVARQPDWLAVVVCRGVGQALHNETRWTIPWRAYMNHSFLPSTTSRCQADIGDIDVTFVERARRDRATALALKGERAKSASSGVRRSVQLPSFSHGLPLQTRPATLPMQPKIQACCRRPQKLRVPLAWLHDR